jgi:hypothetical protein
MEQQIYSSVLGLLHTKMDTILRNVATLYQPTGRIITEHFDLRQLLL